MKTLIKSILLVLLFATFASCTNYDDDVEQDNIENIEANGEDDNYDGSKE